MMGLCLTPRMIWLRTVLTTEVSTKKARLNGRADGFLHQKFFESEAQKSPKVRDLSMGIAAPMPR